MGKVKDGVKKIKELKNVKMEIQETKSEEDGKILVNVHSWRANVPVLYHQVCYLSQKENLKFNQIKQCKHKSYVCPQSWEIAFINQSQKLQVFYTYLFV